MMAAIDPNDPEFRGFVSQMRAAPRDDTTRLVFADWLDERGHETYAGFIRGMVEVGRTDPANRLSLTGWDHVPLKSLFGGPHTRMLSAVKRTWGTWEPLPSLGPAALLWRWHRGTVDQLVIDWESWSRWWPSITAFGPVGEVVLTSRPRLTVADGVQSYRLGLGSRVPGREKAASEAAVVADRLVWDRAEGNQRWRLRDNAIEQLLRQTWKPGEVACFQVDDEAMGRLST